MRSFVNTVRVLGAVALLAALAAPHSATAAAGKVILALGDTTAVNADGQRRSLRRGADIDAGDRLVTGRGRLQVAFTDGGRVSLQPDTEFAIREYRYEGEDKGNETGLFGLLRGGVRAITGFIGRLNKDRYKVVTPAATIGIRGTTFKAELCQGNCGPRADGLYATGGEGTIVVANDAGEIELTRGQSAFAANSSSAPQASSEGADVADTAPPAEAAADDGDDDGGVFTAGDFIAGDAVFTGADVADVVVVRELRGGAVAVSGSVQFGNELFSGGGLAADARSPGDGFGAFKGSFDANDGLVAVSVTGASSGAGAFTVTTPPRDIATDGLLYLGRWTATTGSVIVQGGISETLNADANDNAHYIVGVQDPVVPTTGIGTYEFSGLKTPSTSQSGIVSNGLQSGTIQIDFVSRNVNASLVVDHLAIYNVSTAGKLDAGKPAFDTIGGATGGNCTPSCDAEVLGFLSGAGAVPPRVGASYTIFTADPIVGVGGFDLK